MKLVWASFAAAALLVGCSSAKTKNTAQTTTAAKVTSTSKAASQTGINGTTVTCTKTKGKNTDKRVIVVAVEKHRCVVHYTKFGKTKEIASGGAKSKHCATVQEHIKSSLIKYGFTCK